MNWIETKDRLPTKDDVDKYDSVLAWSIERSDWHWCQWDMVTTKHYAAWISVPPYQLPIPEYRPFTKDEFLPHADRWLKNKCSDYFKTTYIYSNGVDIHGTFQTWATMLDRYTFADDKTPCGVLVDN